MKKLPSIYKNSFSKSIKNNKDYCYLDKDVISNDNTLVKDSIGDVLNNIFKSIGYPYNINVLIKTNLKEYNTYLVSRTKYSVTTIDNEVIKLEEIISIKMI